MFAAFAGSSAYGGTCGRTPKRQVTAIIGRPFARTDFRYGSTRDFRDSYFDPFDVEFVAHALPPAQESNAARLT
jgi:hypothetical protein